MAVVLATGNPWGPTVTQNTIIIIIDRAFTTNVVLAIVLNIIVSVARETSPLACLLSCKKLSVAHPDPSTFIPNSTQSFRFHRELHPNFFDASLTLHC